MKTILRALATPAAIALSSLTFAMSAHAVSEATGAASAPKPTTRMGACSKDATGMKGDERKAFMKTCLSSGKGGAMPAVADMTPAMKEHAKACKAEAKGMTGNARKDFLKECMAKAA